jgi:hypothetical protein
MRYLQAAGVIERAGQRTTIERIEKVAGMSRRTARRVRNRLRKRRG